MISEIKLNMNCPQLNKLANIKITVLKLHIVDDGALTGETVNLDVIQDIVDKFNLKIEVGGGIRNSESIKKYIDAGVKVILGSAAIKDKNF